MRFLLAETSLLQKKILDKNKKLCYSMGYFSTSNFFLYLLKDSIQNFIRYSQSNGKSYSKISLFWLYQYSMFDLIIEDKFYTEVADINNEQGDLDIDQDDKTKNFKEELGMSYEVDKIDEDLFDINSDCFSYLTSIDFTDFIDSLVVENFFNSDGSEKCDVGCDSRDFNFDRDDLSDEDNFFYSSGEEDYEEESNTNESDNNTDEERDDVFYLDLYDSKINHLNLDFYFENDDNLLSEDVGLRVVFTKVPKSLRKNTKGERRFTSYLDFCNYTKSLGYWWRLHRLATLSVFGDYDLYGITFFSFKEFQILNWFLEFNYIDDSDSMFLDFYRWQRETIYSYIETGLSSLDKQIDIKTTVYDCYSLSEAKLQVSEETKIDDNNQSVPEDDMT